jgi:hypothetical protein
MPRYGHATILLNLDEHTNSTLSFHAVMALMFCFRSTVIIAWFHNVTSYFIQSLFISMTTSAGQAENSVLLVLPVVWLRLHVALSLGRGLPQLICVFFDTPLLFLDTKYFSSPLIAFRNTSVLLIYSVWWEIFTVACPHKLCLFKCCCYLWP